MTSQENSEPRQGGSPLTVASKQTRENLGECVRSALDNYFRQLDGHTASDLYRLVLDEVEYPLLEAVLKHTEGNQTRAAVILGISRGTLRKKLTAHHLD
ncbi:MAG: DNA-binding transcriptional regulator Fis [Gammaproteobacteria bacterium]|nr:DNA-binding transcriptional regulator Fis [Gammaproteobacteria bacterium]